MRHWGPQDRGEPSVWWPVIGRNKKAITLDLRQAEGQSIFKELVRKSDVVIENFRPAHWRSGIADGRSSRSSIRGSSWCASPGMGRPGRMRSAPATEALARPWAACATSSASPIAHLHASASASETHWRPCMPAWAPSPPCTIESAPGVGQVIDAAIYESVLNMMESLVTEFDQLGHVRERSGPILPRIAPSNVYPTRDGIVMIGANQDTVFARLAAAMGLPGLAVDARFADHQARGAHQQELDTIIAQLDCNDSDTERVARAARATRRAIRTHLSHRGHARRSAFHCARSHRQHFASALRNPAHAERRAPPVTEPELRSHAGAGDGATQRGDLRALARSRRGSHVPVSRAGVI